MTMPRSLPFVVLLVLATGPGLADDGHDHSRHAAASDVGAAHLETSCADEVKPAFDRALGFLHSFGYEIARDGFREITKRDPQCAMAWWGVAMSHYHPIWAPPSPAEIAAAQDAVAKAAAIEKVDEREKGFVTAIGKFYADADRLDHQTRAKTYRDAMKDLAERFPDEPEAKIFYALSLLGTAPPKDPTHAQEKKAAEILNGLLEKHPRHPGIAHYLIHSFDYPGLAPLALPAARAYAKVAPASPHAQHMPSHIFVRLGLWKESIASNLDSERSANAIVAKSHPGAASYDALHALDYLVYAYLQTGEDELAKKALDRLRAAKTLDVPNFAAGYALAAAPARYALERRAWNEAAALTEPAGHLPWEQYPYALANLHFARAVGAARSGDGETAQKALAEVEKVRDTLRAAPPAGPYDWVGQVESLRLAAAGLVAHASGKSDEAVKLLREAAELQDGVGKHPVTPGEILPAREILADLLLESGKPAEALAEYEATLASSPGRLNALKGAAEAAGAAGNAAKEKDFRARIQSQLAGTSPRAGISRELEKATRPSS